MDPHRPPASRPAPRRSAHHPAVSYCLLGDAIRAGIATDAALHEAEATHCPTPRLAVLLQAALRAGIPPQQIRRILADIDPTPKPD
jgi:hypothetical protein